MRYSMIRYRVAADKAAENESYIARVFEELDRQAPPGLRYAAFRMDDGVSFVHLASSAPGGGQSPLMALPAFRDFTETVRGRCEELPVSSPLQRVGAYNFGVD